MYTSFYNAGLDSAELVSQLRAAHAEEDTKMGVDVVLGQAGDMSKLGIYESFRVGSILGLAASQRPMCSVSVKLLVLSNHKHPD